MRKLTKALTTLQGQPLYDLLQALRDSAREVAREKPEFVRAFLSSIDDFHNGSNRFALPLLLHLREYPVSMEEFMFGQRFLRRPRDEIYDTVLEELINANDSGEYRHYPQYTQAVYTGGIGSAKSTSAQYTLVRQVYVLSCYKSPHSAFGLDSSSEIEIIIQSLAGDIAQTVNYDRIRSICENSFYFQHDFPFDPKVKTKLIFPNRVVLKSIASDGGSIGQNVIGGMMDEVNFMKKIKGSRKSIDGGEYNQASVIYDGLSRRMKSRFANEGPMPGILCVVSSKRYPGEFTDVLIEESRTDPTIYVYDKRVWDVKPKGTFKRFFPVFVGDLTRKARVLTEVEAELFDPKLLVRVPEQFRNDFKRDIIGALRDVAGVGTFARFPFIYEPDRAVASFKKDIQSIFSLDTMVFGQERLQFFQQRFINPGEPRAVHFDLGLTKDAVGFTIGHVDRFKKIDRGDFFEVLPNIRIDGQLRIKAPPGGEVEYAFLRRILYALIEAGLNIKWVTFDQFQSADFMQQLKARKILAGKVSLDVTTIPYEITRDAMYDGRLDAPYHEFCIEELFKLEKDPRTGKIDHPSDGSKDVSDSLAGVCYTLTTRRELWNRHGVPLNIALLNRLHESSMKDAQKAKQQAVELDE